MLQPLHVALDHAFAGAVGVVGFAPTVAGDRADDGELAAPHLLHARADGFGKERGGDAVNHQLLAAEGEVALARLLLGKHAVGNKRPVHGGDVPEALNEGVNGGSVAEVGKHPRFHDGLRRAHAQVGGDALHALGVAGNEGDAFWPARCPVARAVLRHRRRCADDDKVVRRHPGSGLFGLHLAQDAPSAAAAAAHAVDFFLPLRCFLGRFLRRSILGLFLFLCLGVHGHLRVSGCIGKVRLLACCTAIAAVRHYNSRLFRHTPHGTRCISP